jgi:hypothetical protein
MYDGIGISFEKLRINWKQAEKNREFSQNACSATSRVKLRVPRWIDVCPTKKRESTGKSIIQ